MSVAYTIAGAVLAVVLVGSAFGKLTRAQQVVDSMNAVGVPPRMYPFLAACEIAGAIGLVAGIWIKPLGIAAAIGVVLYFLGAVGAHIRKSDFKGMPPAAVFLVFSAAVLVLRLTA
ncbi:DoxX family protein [Amycolatopsis pigmentata]|uniref:DoxX family protein n=1 Tax=Amycolatopsis pigmentata TaxID=450801 RepID=A0ABW5G6K4_9PSEU